MTSRVLGGVQLAGAVLLAGGLLTGFAPVSLQHYGCTNGFGALDVEDGTSMDVVLACAQERSGRQLGAAGPLTVGGALLAGATYVRTGSTAEGAREQRSGAPAAPAGPA